LTILALAISEISMGARKCKMRHVTPTMPLLRVMDPPYVGTGCKLLVYKIWPI